MKRRIFNLSELQQLGKLVKVLTGPLEAGHPLTITVEPYQKIRTLLQNNRMWAVLTDISGQLEVGPGILRSKEAWHFKLRIEFGYIDGTIEVDVGGIPTEMPRPKSSTKFTRQEMTDYQTQCEVYGIERGVIFTYGNDAA